MLSLCAACPLSIATTEMMSFGGFQGDSDADPDIALLRKRCRAWAGPFPGCEPTSPNGWRLVFSRPQPNGPIVVTLANCPRAEVRSLSLLAECLRAEERVTIGRTFVELADDSTPDGFVTMAIEARIRPVESDTSPSTVAIQVFRAAKRPRDEDPGDPGTGANDRSVASRQSVSQPSPVTSRELVPAASRSLEVGRRPKNQVPTKTAIPAYLVDDLAQWFVPVLSQPQVACALDRFESAVSDASVGKFGGILQNFNNSKPELGVTDVVAAMTGPGVVDFEALQSAEDFIQEALTGTTGLRMLPMAVVNDAILIHLRHKLLPEEGSSKVVARVD